MSYFHLSFSKPPFFSPPLSLLVCQTLDFPSDSPLIFAEALIGAIVSAPINPIIASSLFFLSYARPVKFWEKNYKYGQHLV